MTNGKERVGLARRTDTDGLPSLRDDLRRDVLSAIRHLAGMETWLLHEDHLSRAEQSLRNADLSLQRVETRLADRRAWMSGGRVDDEVTHRLSCPLTQAA